MTAVVADQDLRSLALQSRAEEKELVIITNSGSQYILTPCAGMKWKIVRIGCDGSRPTVHHGRAYAWPGTDDLVIGPWQTTGLREVFVMD